ncbi:hypothetical protein F5148DRAFT_1201204 [Russula earlei]|uniref:Uncharacterized protein n=1 Tax=Russula earlei TaxID=71964 RepID=A0ACC0U9H6_9AGAM|nr:hypothetical protein F5148DRAFT_1201204 [Russula earlei]
MTLPPPLLPQFLPRATCVSLCFSPSFLSFLLSFSSQAAVATTMSLSQWQPQRDGHDHDCDMEWHKQPPRVFPRAVIRAR